MTTGHGRSDRVAERLSAELARWVPREAEQRELKSDYERFLAHEGAVAIERDLGRAHVTGSAFVFTPDRRNVLLCLHKKADLWLQLGGHIEPVDDSVRATARREAEEEGGILDLVAIGDGPLDVDRHALGPGFIRCDTHWDIGYGFLAAGTPTVSDESDAVEWWPVDRLPANVPSTFATRIRRVAQNAFQCDDDIAIGGR